jgi:two-component system, NarL family, response regulator NreC
MSTIRLLLADDHLLFRAGLRSMLQNQSELEIVGEANDGHSAIKLTEELSPDVLLLDISMPGLNGLETLRKLHDLGTATRTVILSMHSDRHYVTESIKAGARGYLLKDSTLDELVNGIKAVMRGEVYLSSRIAGVLVSDYMTLSTVVNSSADILTSREREVLQLIAEGNSTKDVASRLNVSVKTIETHRKRIMDKLNLHSVAELTRYAIREKIIQSD